MRRAITSQSASNRERHGFHICGVPVAESRRAGREREIEATGMDEDIKGNDAIEMPANASRRTFIKGIICSGATAFSAGYLFRASLGVPELFAQAAISERLLTLHV